jgi:ribosome-associated translation inhibitor RaiA
MNISVEAHNIELSPEWKKKLEARLDDLSDPRDPVISARATCTFNPGQQPPAEVNMVLKMRGKNIVINKRADHVDAALQKVLDTVKREIHQFYDMRTEHRVRPGKEGEEAAAPVIPVDETDN